MAASDQLLQLLDQYAQLEEIATKLFAKLEKERGDRSALEKQLAEITAKAEKLEKEKSEFFRKEPSSFQKFQNANPSFGQKVEGVKKILAAVKKAIEQEVDITRGFTDETEKSEFFKKGPFSIGVIKTTKLDSRITIVNETYEFSQKVKDKTGKRTTAAMNNTKVSANQKAKNALKKEGFNVTEELATAPVLELNDVPVSYYTVTDFEHNYLEWLIRDKVAEDEVRIRSTAMKHLFRFVFGSKRVQDITGFYNQMKIAYSNLEPSDKFPCHDKNAQLWEDFRSCFEWRSELALEELVKIRASGIPEFNQTVHRLKELLLGLHALLIQLDREGGPCFQYSDKEYVTAAEFIDEDLVRLLRIFRNFVREKKDGKAVPDLVALKESFFSKAPVDRSETEQQLYDNLLKLLEWTSGGMPVDKALEKLKALEQENLELDALTVTLLQLLKYANGMWEIKSKIDLLACKAKACCDKKQTIGQTTAELQAELTALQQQYDQVFDDLPPDVRQGPIPQQIQAIRTALGAHIGAGDAVAGGAAAAQQLPALQQQLAALQQQLGAEQAGRAANTAAAAAALAAAQQAQAAAAAAAQAAQQQLQAEIARLTGLLAQPRADPAELEEARRAVAAAEAAAAAAAGRLAATEAERDGLRAADAAKAETIRTQGEALAGAAALLAQKDQDLAALQAAGGASAEAIRAAQTAAEEARAALAGAQAQHAAALAAARAETEGVRGKLAAAQEATARAAEAAEAQLEAARTATAAAAREAEEARAVAAAAAAAGPAAQEAARAALEAAEERARAAEAAQAEAEAAAAAVRDRAAAADAAEAEAGRLAGELDAKTGEAARTEEARAAAAAEAEARAAELAGLRQQLAAATEAGTEGAAQAAGLQGRVAALEAAQAEANAAAAAAATKAAADAEAIAALRAQLAEEAAAAAEAARAAAAAHAEALEAAHRARQGELEAAIRDAEEAAAALAAARAAGGEAQAAAEARVGEASAALELKAGELRALQEALNAAQEGTRALEGRLGTLGREKGDAEAAKAAAEAAKAEAERGKAAAERGKAATEAEKQTLQAAIKRLSDARRAAGGQGAALAIDAPLAVLRDELAAVEGDLAAQRAAIAAAEARARGAEEGRAAAAAAATNAQAAARAAEPRIAAAEGLAARAQANVEAAQQRIRELENFAYNLPLINIEGLSKSQKSQVEQLMKILVNNAGWGKRSLSHFREARIGGTLQFDSLNFDEKRALISTALFGEDISRLRSLLTWFTSAGGGLDAEAHRRIVDVISKFIQVKETSGARSAAYAAVSARPGEGGASGGQRPAGGAAGGSKPPAGSGDLQFAALMARQFAASQSLASGEGKAAPTGASRARAAGGVPSSEDADLAWAHKMVEGLDAEKRAAGESAAAPAPAPMARQGSAGPHTRNTALLFTQMDQNDIRRRLRGMLGTKFQNLYFNPRQLDREIYTNKIIQEALSQLGGKDNKTRKLTESYVELILLAAASAVLERADIRDSDFTKGYFPAMGGGARSRSPSEADEEPEDPEGPTIPAASTQDLCQTMLLLLLLEASQGQTIDPQEFLDKAGTTLDALGQCPLVLHVLNELLDSAPDSNDEDMTDLVFRSVPDEDEMLPTQLETLSRSLREAYSPEELEVLKSLAPSLTLYAQPHEEFQEILGAHPYFAGGQGSMLKGLEDEDIDVTDEERAKLIPEGDGISLGALRLLYLVCLREVLEGGEIPSPDSKCLAKPKRHRPSSRPRARPHPQGAKK
jgi:hypothetical protein